MKKISLLLSALLLTISLAGCSDKSSSKAPASDTSSTEDTAVANAVQEVEDPSEIEEVIGADLSVSAEDSSYALISQSIGEVSFTKDKITYNLRASKDLVADAMAGIESALKDDTTEETINDVTIQLGSYEDGTLIAFWTKDKVNYSLTCKDAEETDLKDAVAYVMENE